MAIFRKTSFTQDVGKVSITQTFVTKPLNPLTFSHKFAKAGQTLDMRPLTKTFKSLPQCKLILLLLVHYIHL